MEMYESNNSVTATTQFNSDVRMTSLTGQCRWTVLNWIQTLFLLLTLAMNVVAMYVIFKVPIITSRGTKNSLYFCIRCLNVIDILQVFTLYCTTKKLSVTCRVQNFGVPLLLLTQVVKCYL